MDWSRLLEVLRQFPLRRPPSEPVSVCHFAQALNGLTGSHEFISASSLDTLAQSWILCGRGQIRGVLLPLEWQIWFAHDNIGLHFNRDHLRRFPVSLSAGADSWSTYCYVWKAHVTLFGCYRNLPILQRWTHICERLRVQACLGHCGRLCVYGGGQRAVQHGCPSILLFPHGLPGLVTPFGGSC